MTTQTADHRHGAAVEFCAGMPLADPSLQLMTEDITVPDFLDALIQHEQHIDAAQVLARMLPPREGVWWATQCVTASFNEKTRLQEKAALRAAEAWVGELSEESRYAAFEAAQDARLGSPANCVGMAAFLSGPSLAPQGEKAVPPAPGFAAQMVAGTVMASSVSENAEESRTRLVQFLEQGRAILQTVGRS